MKPHPSPSSPSLPLEHTENLHPYWKESPNPTAVIRAAGEAAVGDWVVFEKQRECLGPLSLSPSYSVVGERHIFVGGALASEYQGTSKWWTGGCEGTRLPRRKKLICNLKRQRSSFSACPQSLNLLLALLSHTWNGSNKVDHSFLFYRSVMKKYKLFNNYKGI